MQYFYEKHQYYQSMYGSVYEFNHPVYSRCTLFKIGDRGLGVIQQRYDSATKQTLCGEIDLGFTDELYLYTKFKAFFDERSGTKENSIYPTVTNQQIMWALKMKPIPREQ